MEVFSLKKFNFEKLAGWIALNMIVCRARVDRWDEVCFRYVYRVRLLDFLDDVKRFGCSIIGFEKYNLQKGYHRDIPSGWQHFPSNLQAMDSNFVKSNNFVRYAVLTKCLLSQNSVVVLSPSFSFANSAFLTHCDTFLFSQPKSHQNHSPKLHFPTCTRLLMIANAISLTTISHNLYIPFLNTAD